LVSLSVDEERRVIIWSLTHDSSLKTTDVSLLEILDINGSGNTILVDPTSNDELLIFYVLGSAGFFFKYEYNVEQRTTKAINCLKKN